MKKMILCFVTIVLLIAAPAMAVDFKTANQTTVAWDQDFGGIPQVEIYWNVYLVNFITDPGKTKPVKIGTTKETSYTITLNAEGRFLVGVAAARMVDETELESDKVWSDNSTPAFGVQYFMVPLKPTGLIVK